MHTLAPTQGVVFPRDRWPCRNLNPVSPTVLRCLGIPTRVVTNFNSAHDQNSNLLIEYFHDKDGVLQRDKSEMIW